MRKLLAGLSIMALMLALASIPANTVSAGHAHECGYTSAVNGDNYNVVIGNTADEQGYYFEMDDPDVRVTNLASDRYRVHFTEADAGQQFTFYAQAYTPRSSVGGYSFCEVHGGFRVKGK